MAGTIVWKGKSSLFTAGVNTVLVEAPDSPKYTFATPFTCIRKFTGLHSLCIASAPFPRSYGVGSMAGWMIKQSTVDRKPKQIGELTIEYVGAGGDSGGGGDPGPGAILPPDEYGLHPFEVNPKLEQHPLFASLDRATRAAVRTAVDSQTSATRDSSYTGLSTLAKKLADKLLEGKETYYLAGWTYTWSTYSWAIPGLTDGGTIETPGGPLASYLGTGVDWLRHADDLDFNGQHHKKTLTWLGGPAGHWDSELYP